MAKKAGEQDPQAAIQEAERDYGPDHLVVADKLGHYATTLRRARVRPFDAVSMRIVGIQLIAILCMVIFFTGFAVTASEKLTESAVFNQQGLQSYRQQRYEEALQLFNKAIQKADPDSIDQLTALNNLVAVYEALNRPDELWRTQHDAYILRNKLQGTVIPDDYNGKTPTEAQENRLLKRLEIAALSKKDSRKVWDARMELLHFYEDTHQYEKAKNVISCQVGSVPSTDPRLVSLHRGWATWCRAEGHPTDAAMHDALSAETEQRIQSADRERIYKVEQAARATARTEEQRRIQRAKNESEHFNQLMREPAPEPGLFDDSYAVGAARNLKADQGRILNQLLREYENYRSLVQKTSGPEQLKTKAKCVDSLNDIRRNARYCLTESNSCDVRNIKLYLLQAAYRGYREFLDKGDARLEEIYNDYMQTRQEEDAAIRAKAAEYK